MKKNILVLLFIIMFLFGCAKEPLPTPATTPEELAEEVPEIVEEIPEEPLSNEGALSLFVSSWNAEENLISNFDKLEVTFSKIKVYELKSFEPIEYNINVAVDLTELKDKNVMKIINTELKEGKYAKIKLYASSIKGEMLGHEFEVIIPGEAITLTKDFEITTDRALDFVFSIKTVKTGKTTTTTRLDQYALKSLISKSGIIGQGVYGVEEVTRAEMNQRIQDKKDIKITKIVKMTSKGFTPADLTIEKGTTIKWVNEDKDSLGIISEVFDRTIRAGGSYSQTFYKAKEIPYYLKFHPSIKGKITITSPEVVEEPIVVTRTKRIDVTSEGFSTATLTVKKNTKVEWVNKDTQIHNIVSPGLFEESLKSNEVFTQLFTEIGEFPFYDSYNPGKYSGKIVVTE